MTTFDFENIYRFLALVLFLVQVRSQALVQQRCCQLEPEEVEDHRLYQQTWATVMIIFSVAKATLESQMSVILSVRPSVRL